jgi:adenosylcobinamide-phosphate synthase
MTNLIALFTGWVLDLILGDPARLPHPIVWFGKAIAFFEHRLNGGSHRRLKGALTAVGLIAATFAIGLVIDVYLSFLKFLVVFYCLAGTTLIREVRQVFLAVDRSLDEGRQQVARIVGRDTSELSAQEVRTAALETLAENLSDGVIAPLFWLMLLGTPGMLAYKMVNTLDSMIGYHTERYLDFGCWAAHIDDVANYIPARLTAVLMVIFTSSPFHHFTFIRKYGRNHASPNSGYPEAALASILDCQFGGPHKYFGEVFDKPFIGENDRELSTADMKTAVRVNRTAEVIMVIIVLAESAAILLLSR